MRADPTRQTLVENKMVLFTTVLAVVFCCHTGCRKVTPPTPPARLPATADLDSPGATDRSKEVLVPPGQATGVAAVDPVDLGKQLYARHCEACHGERGDGKGIAAAFVFPKPRDFQGGRFRLVSTANNVPSREDLHGVLLRGMPGSSMPPWGHLSKEDREALVDEVMRLRRVGARERFAAILKEDEELTDEEIAEEAVQAEIRDFVTRSSTAGEQLPVPEISEATEDSLARGKKIYIQQSCHSCHGNEGKGDGVQKQFDDEGYATKPRDYTKGLFKGGHDAVSLYRRIARGMPGTPMPGSTTMSPEQMIDLVHYLRSMSTEEQRQAAILDRRTIRAKVVSTFPASADSATWSDIEPVALRMTPLWWRDGADPDLQVQAVHDGSTIALRISWKDETEDTHAASSGSFEDAVAMQLYQGDAEPFLGMGALDSPVDAWFWDADRQGQPLAVEELYPNSVVDIYPFSETAVATAELDRDGARTGDQPDISLPARASGNQIVPTGEASGASSLTGGGPGSITFRIPRSQAVSAQGKWSNSRWTVLMTRPLAVDSAVDGVSLSPGDRASVAFAVWNGSHQDRDGKKLITIWQDLELEN